MGDLSKDFDTDEFRCKCCGKAKVDPRLVAALQELRNRVGAKITITPHGGCRCPVQNKKSGGKPKSFHLLGMAADIVIEGLSVLEMFQAAEQVEAFRNGGMHAYLENGFVHVDVRNSRARWNG